MARQFDIGRVPAELRTRISAEAGCWLWTGTRFNAGYGRARFEGADTLAHRTIYRLLAGPIPDGLQLDHLCRVRACVNPAHLEPVTCRVNLLRGNTLQAANAAKTECLRGHPFDAANTYLKPGGVWRGCRACRSVAAREFQARKMEAKTRGAHSSNQAAN